MIVDFLVELSHLCKKYHLGLGTSCGENSIIIYNENEYLGEGLHVEPDGNLILSHFDEKIFTYKPQEN